ncbi:hypothetical protein LAZ67_8003705 [Cordylochernes scorpioides]|uniref:Major facilitator superfamily (MFS) profile domain-containing protein n=1 Tax=Cordylochernes scorpioides TaxID=51811 RepID=A0ABY6KTS4_9ARAC|nr:hypothetical protein LAZ67_8003705 [Cordylochernes scorpioides]
MGRGIGYGMMYLPAVVTVGLFFKKRLALATGIAVCGTGAGTFIIPIIINYFLVPYGWRFTFLVLGILNFSCVLPGLAFIKNKPPRVPPIALVPPDVVWTDTKNFEEVDLESENEEDSPEIDEKVVHSNLALTTSQMNMFGGSELSLSVTGSSSLFDLSLLKDLRLLFLASSGLFTVAASMTVYTYIAMFAKDVGMPEGQSSMFLSVVGLSNTLGRILLGAFTDSPHVSALVLNHIGLLGGGLVVALWPFFPFLEAFYINSILFGLSIATFGSLRSVITVEYLGRDKLSRAFGLQVVVQGISGLAAPPLGGKYVNILDNYLSVKDT